MHDREKVIAWLTEISLRPCDFTRDDFDAAETERLANDAIEIVEDAEIFCKQRNDAIALLKEQEAKEQISDAIHEMAKQFRKPLVRCKDCKFMYEDDVFQCGIKAGYFPVHEDWFCADGERRTDESTNHA